MTFYILFNFFINAIFTFLTCCLLVELVIQLLRINNYRMRYLARIIPICKLLLDVTRYNLSNWAIPYGLDPVSAEIGSRSLTIFTPLFHFSDYGLPLSLNIFFHLKNGLTFTIADAFSHIATFPWIVTITTTLLCLGLFNVIRTLVKQITNPAVPHILKKATPFPFMISNTKLKKNRTEIPHCIKELH